VTGATGFVGRHLVERLLEDRVGVRTLVRRVEPGSGREVEQAEVSLGDRDALGEALDGCDVLVHLAAPRRPADGGHRPGDRELLVRGAENLLLAALDAGVDRCVFASSTSVFGPAWSTVDERSTVAPATPYARARLEGDRRVARLARESGAEVVIVRMSEIFGPGSNAHPGLMRAVARGDMRVVGSGRQPHQLLEVRDGVRALVSAGRTAVDRPDTVLVVSGPGNTFREWIESLGRALGAEVAFTPALDRPARWALRWLARIPGAEVLPRYRQVDYHVRPRSYDVTRSIAALGVYHRSPFDAAVADMVDAHRREVGLG
jgi:UDP-glucose 4-epimerase